MDKKEEVTGPRPKVVFVPKKTAMCEITVPSYREIQRERGKEKRPEGKKHRTLKGPEVSTDEDKAAGIQSEMGGGVC